MKLVNSICFLCVLLASCGGNKQPKLAVQNKEYLIAYNVLLPNGSANNYDIFTMSLDGSKKKNITNHSDVAWTYTSYKNKLFFISDRDTCSRCYFLYESNFDGTEIKRVSSLQLEDSWMSSRHNGQELIVSGRIGKRRYQLFLINTNSGEYTQLTNDTNAMYADPCFSPDGKQIVFSFKKNKQNKSSHEELFLMNADGTNINQITHYPEGNSSSKDYGYRAGAAKWHPTENFISYVSKQDGRHSIFAVTPDGKKQWKLTNNDFAEGWHDWSSDGKWLVFNNSDWQESQFNITLMNWENKMQKQLTDSTFKIQQSPVFVEIMN